MSEEAVRVPSVTSQTTVFFYCLRKSSYFFLLFFHGFENTDRPNKQPAEVERIEVMFA